MAELAGRTAVVTGASRGIGLEVARGLGRAGAAVVVVARRPAGVDAAVGVLRAEGLDAVGAACDVSDAAAVRALPDRLSSAAGRPLGADVLVCAAGTTGERGLVAKTLQSPDALWREVMATNLDGAFACLSTFVPGMVERRWGRVVTVSACMGRFSGPGLGGGWAAYRVSKTALTTLTRNLGAELGHGRRGVLVDAVCPGHCRTDLGGPAAPRSAAQGADTAVWLATRPAAGALTGLLWEDRAVVPF